jgi:hypothetical protein
MWRQKWRAKAAHIGRSRHRPNTRPRVQGLATVEGAVLRHRLLQRPRTRVAASAIAKIAVLFP